MTARYWKSWTSTNAVLGIQLYKTDFCCGRVQDLERVKDKGAELNSGDVPTDPAEPMGVTAAIDENSLYIANEDGCVRSPYVDTTAMSSPLTQRSICHAESNIRPNTKRANAGITPRVATFSLIRMNQ